MGFENAGIILNKKNNSNNFLIEIKTIQNCFKWPEVQLVCLCNNHMLFWIHINKQKENKSFAIILK